MTMISDTLAAQAPVQPATKPANTMGQSDFLRLMTTQMTTQDPFNPVDNTQMVAQMAQFSQVAGIAEMNASLKALVLGWKHAPRQGTRRALPADLARPLHKVSRGCLSSDHNGRRTFDFRGLG